MAVVKGEWQRKNKLPFAADMWTEQWYHCQVSIFLGGQRNLKFANISDKYSLILRQKKWSIVPQSRPSHGPRPRGRYVSSLWLTWYYPGLPGPIIMLAGEGTFMEWSRAPWCADIKWKWCYHISNFIHDAVIWSKSSSNPGVLSPSQSVAMQHHQWGDITSTWFLYLKIFSF